MSAPTGQGPRHLTWTLPYSERAHLPGTSTLANYLFTLIASKGTNLCLSADVTSTRDLLRVAEEVGDSICLLKTHCDHIEDFSDRTSRALTEIARRRRFLIFEDRKFLDIGSKCTRWLLHAPIDRDCKSESSTFSIPVRAAVQGSLLRTRHCSRTPFPFPLAHHCLSPTPNGKHAWTAG